MALPAIAPYPMPNAGDLPPGRVRWTVEPGRAALLIHDMQRYFVDAYDAAQEPIPELIANILRLRERCHALGIPVIYSAQPAAQSPDERGLLQDFWGNGIGAGPGEASIIDELTPTAADTLLTKWRYSAFVRTSLHDELRSRGRDQLMICGIYAHIGCLMTAAQAFMEEVQPFLLADAVADFSEADHRMALGYAASRCAVTVSTESALEALGAAAATRDAPMAAAATQEPATGSATGRPGVVTCAEVRARLGAITDEPLESFGDHEDLADAGLDSIRLMRVIAEWQAGGHDVTFERLAEEPTIAAWASLLSGSASGAAGTAAAQGASAPESHAAPAARA